MRAHRQVVWHLRGGAGAGGRAAGQAARARRGSAAWGLGALAGRAGPPAARRSALGSHGAGLGGGVDHAAGQVRGAHLLAGLRCGAAGGPGGRAGARGQGGAGLVGACELGSRIAPRVCGARSRPAGSGWLRPGIRSPLPSLLLGPRGLNPALTMRIASTSPCLRAAEGGRRAGVGERGGGGGRPPTRGAGKMRRRAADPSRWQRRAGSARASSGAGRALPAAGGCQQPPGTRGGAGRAVPTSTLHALTRWGHSR